MKTGLSRQRTGLFFVVQDGLFRLPEVDGDGLAAVRPTRLVYSQILGFCVKPGRDRERRLSGAGIVRAAQLCQRRVRAHIQLRQLIGAAGQLRQCRIRAHIQRRQLIAAAVQIRQRRVRADIQRRQRIGGAGQPRQRCVCANI